jgi:predicted DNA binding CopG/RHH family protein
MEPAIGVKESEFMSERIKYTDEPLGDLQVIPDFLPRPEDLVFRDEGVKVTISLSKRSVDFFKDEARKHNTQYQRMIRRLLDAYAEHHAKRRLTTRLARTRAKAARAG